MVALGVGAALTRALLGEALANAITVVGCLAAVLATPVLWRRWRARGAITLQLEDTTVRVRHADGQVRTAAITALEPCTFRYRVIARVGSGTYRTPAFRLTFADGGAIAVGVPSSALHLPGGRGEVTRPDYLMGSADWQDLVERLGRTSRQPHA